MNVLSLFSGIGGLELGLERAGMTVVGQVELDPFCRAVLTKHWPEVPRHDDVRTAVAWWRDGGDTRPTVDLIAGGFPCQPVSQAGRRLAQDDERWLWPAMADVIRELRPRYALMENVPGLLIRGMGDVLSELAEIGYDTEWRCVSAASVGAPHLRERVFIIAVADPCGDGWEPRRPGDTKEGPRGREPRRGRVGSHDVANAAGAERREPQLQGMATPGRRTAEPRERDSGEGTLSNWWATEPDVGRVANGIPGRVDRLRAIGNAVVPQVAERVGRLILAADRKQVGA